MPLSEILSVEDAAAMDSTISEDKIGREGIDEENHNADDQSSPEPLSSGLTEVEKLERYLSVREEMYKKAKEFDSKIIDFETAIRRPYFHVRPLDEAQLENWHNYLDFIETVEDFNKVCLVSSCFMLIKLFHGQLSGIFHAFHLENQYFTSYSCVLHHITCYYGSKCGVVVYQWFSFSMCEQSFFAFTYDEF